MSMRSAFTAIELLVVMAIGATMAGLVVPGVVSAIGRSQGAAAADAVIAVAAEARRQSLRAAGGQHHGVLIERGADGEASWATLTRGPQVDAASILRDGNGQPVLRKRIPAVYEVVGIAPGATAGWLYQPGTGYPLAAAGGRPVVIGRPVAGSPLPALAVRGPSGTWAIEVYEIGVARAVATAVQ
jgi:prepilin-type N-terminal cleavage/methylation domain-containing protein